mmetsp:Transcript_19630/g.26620  ORF Transcript_19630/g.26620 Transcript_19630/m.26620 type:complete len:222 (+) Transcript_19630:1336-2001(+)
MSSLAVVSVSSWKVWRFRLFTPITSAPQSSAISSSSSVCTSTSGSIPRARDAVMSSDSCVSSRIATMSRIVSAPFALASRSWYWSTMKSFRSIAGRCQAEVFSGVGEDVNSRLVASRTLFMSSREPLNQRGSVSTEITEAPTDAYVLPWSAASAPSAITPLLGEARLNSAAIAIFSDWSRARRDNGPPCAASKAVMAACNSSTDTRALASSTFAYRLAVMF